MNYEQEQQFAAEVKRYVTEQLPLSQISDSELQQQIEDIVEQRIGAGYCSIEQRVSIVEQVYSSIRGFGLLDSIIKDDTITEVMINGPENVFIEQNGCSSWTSSSRASGSWRISSRGSWALRAVRSIRPTLSATPGFPTAPVSMWCCRPLPCAAPRSPSESSPRPL